MGRSSNDLFVQRTPATIAGVFETTVTDFMGFFIYLVARNAAAQSPQLRCLYREEGLCTEWETEPLEGLVVIAPYQTAYC